MLGISRDFMPLLFGGATVLIGLFVFLAIRTARSKHFRRQPQVNIPQQRQPIDFGNNTAEMAAAVRSAFRRSTEVVDLINLATAMTGYGPTLGDESLRFSAAEIMGESVYNMFIKSFRAAAGIPEDIMFDKRPLEDIAGRTMSDLLWRDELLALLVSYAMIIEQFYSQNKSNATLSQILPPVVAMNAYLDKLVLVHQKFYAHPDDEN